MSNSFIWPIDGTLSSATTLSQSGPGSNDTEGVLQNSGTGALPSDAVLCHIQDTHWGGFYPSIEMQLVYSTAPA